MPKIYRVMSEDAGQPEVGTSRDMLGARPNVDIKPDATGNVGPNGKGMSVNICPCQIPGLIMPARLNHLGLKRGAFGDDELKIWRMGDGSFLAGTLATNLELYPDTKSNPVSHGVVQPDTVMPLNAYQNALANTKEDWSQDEQRNSACPFCNSAS